MEQYSVTVHPGVLRASAGAAEFMSFMTIQSDPKDFMTTSKANGWQFYATVAPSHSFAAPATLGSLSTSPLAEKPCVLMLGNEEEGLPNWLVGAANKRITITGHSGVSEAAELDSLNVSVAAALFIERFLTKPTGEKASASQAQEKVEQEEMREDQLF